MTVTSAANALILSAVVASSIDNVDMISASTAGGEIFRKAPTAVVEVISATERKYTFYLTENEGNGTLVKVSLYGEGATTALGTGIELANQTVNIPKDASKSLLIYWAVKVQQAI